jgi:hypothetical protein
MITIEGISEADIRVGGRVQGTQTDSYLIGTPLFS